MRLGGRGSTGSWSEHGARRRGQFLGHQGCYLGGPPPNELARPVVVVRALDAHLEN